MRNQYTWAVDGAGNPYVASIVKTTDTDLATQKQTKTEQTVDVHGNVTETKVYEYGSGTTPATSVSRTYTHTYLTGTAYAARHIYNRLTLTQLTAGGVTTDIAYNGYDSTYPCGSYGYLMYPYPPGTGSPTLHDSTAYPVTQTVRGNVTSQLVGNDTVCLNYDNTGRLAFTRNTSNGLSADIGGGPALAVPGAITPNGEANLRTSFNYNSFLGLTTVSGPNGFSSNTTYDQYGRVATRISPHGAGAVESYDYANRKQTTTINNRRVETTMDGLGRAVRVETWATGQGSAASIVLTEYGPCACSPTGKVQRESLPYKVGQTVRWRTYTYDAFGRTTQVLEADGVSRTVYEYAGNTTKITDAAGKWKKFTYDAFGNLVKVTEPDPTHGNVDTLYTYDKYDRLTNVSMTRGAVTQTRTFAYYGLTKQLTQTTNPENGTVQYEYNNAHRLWRKTDAKGQKVE